DTRYAALRMAPNVKLGSTGLTKRDAQPHVTIRRRTPGTRPYPLEVVVGHLSPDVTHGAKLVTTFFDIKRAFDTVWHAKLLDKLSSIGISGRLYQFVQAFLADRRISVRVGASLSDEHTLDMGVPQGSVIAPTLFSVMLHDIEAKPYAHAMHRGSRNNSVADGNESGKYRFTFVN
ncbi:hypothetical protein BaRGS_00018164, partial [Batillaria attramentaria]